MKNLLIGMISGILIISLAVQPAFAFSVAEKSDAQLISENIAVLENALASHNTDVITELNKMIAEYQELATKADTAEKTEQINNLIVALEALQNEYQLYDTGISTNRFHIVYAPIVAAAIAYFNVNNYILAAELLTHATENTELNSGYVPTHGARARNSEVIQQIANNTVISGSSIFPKGDRPVDMDLYYAIRKFNFMKSFPSARVVYISDRYDYDDSSDYESGGVEGAMLDMMYKVQEAGYLVPFFTFIEVAV